METRAIHFGPFTLVPAEHLLLEADKPVRLGSRAIEMLIMLAERRGELVGKEELIQRIWPNTFVEEANLRTHISALRRTLGDGQSSNRYIQNVPGRGYRFVAPVSFSNQPAAPVFAAANRSHNLPIRLTRMIGRSEFTAMLVSMLPQHRFISVVGPGGVGKTTVAIAAANELLLNYQHGLRFVDFGPLGDPLLVPSVIASALGLEVSSGAPLHGLTAFLQDKHMLLVLDNCDHVIDITATLAVDVLAAASGVNILATSREPLRASGERVHRLLPLQVPSSSTGLMAAEALTFSAIQLFVERAMASLDTFELSDAEAPIVADICRKLDGIALAIELAAGRVDTFGVRDLATLLEDRLGALKSVIRTTLPRHQTLSATLDWSYEFLPEPEQFVFRCMAVFSGSFTMEAACSVMMGTGMSRPIIVDCVASLVAKSLLTADISGAQVHYRLLDTTRVYAVEKLRSADEFARIARLHAEYYRDLFVKAKAEWQAGTTAEWLETYGSEIDNVRSALNWAFAPQGDGALGVALTIAAVPLWVQLYLPEECRERVGQALSKLDPNVNQSESQRSQLTTALAAAWVIEND